LKANTNNGGAFILRKSSASSTGYVITCLERKLSAFEVIHYKVELDENGKYYISDKTDLFSSWKELFLHSPKLITFSPLYNVEFLEKAQYLTKTVENLSPDANETFGLIPNKSQIEKLMSKDRLDENDESKNPNGTTYVTFPMEEDKKNKNETAYQTLLELKPQEKRESKEISSEEKNKNETTYQTFLDLKPQEKRNSKEVDSTYQTTLELKKMQDKKNQKNKKEKEEEISPNQYEQFPDNASKKFTPPPKEEKEEKENTEKKRRKNGRNSFCSKDHHRSSVF